MSESLNHFPLYPWSYFQLEPGVDLAHARTSIAYTNSDGSLHTATYKLKRKGDRVFFRTDSRIECEFAITSPCEVEAKDLVTFWREEFERGNYARFHYSYWGFRKDGNSTPLGSTAIIYLLNADGSGWLREWCGGEWLPFDSISDGEQVYLWDEKLFKPGLHVDFDKQLFWLLHETPLTQQQAILERDFGPDERLEMPVTWLSASLEEWELFLTHYYRLDLESVLRNFGFQGDDWDGLFQGQIGPKSMYGDGWGGNFISTPGFSNGWRVHEMMQHFCNVKALIWVPVEGENPAKRSGWDCLTPPIDYKVRLSLEVTWHQKMEALRYLRDWLRGKVPDNDIENCLSIIQT